MNLTLLILIFNTKLKPNPCFLLSACKSINIHCIDTILHLATFIKLNMNSAIAEWIAGCVCKSIINIVSLPATLQSTIKAAKYTHALNILSIGRTIKAKY